VAAQANTVQADQTRQFQSYERVPTEGRVEGPVAPPPERRLDREKITSAEWVGGDSTVEILGGAGALVLAILGFTGLVPGILTSVGIIVLGGTLFLYGGFLLARSRRLVSEMEAGVYRGAEFATGAGLDFLAGAAGITLGILAVIGLGTAVLSAVAILLFGAALLFDAGTIYRLHSFQLGRSEPRPWTDRLSAWTFSSLQAVVGIGAITLGIIALAGVVPFILTLVSVLVIGSSLIVCGMANNVRMMSVIGR
jgi:hypothetical protein